MSFERMLGPVFAACASLATIAGCSSVADDGVIADASLVVINDSDVVIEGVFVTLAGNPSWGPNLLHGDVLRPGEDLSTGVDCTHYDALVVDEDGVECATRDLDLCIYDATWVINKYTCSVLAAAATRATEARL